MVKNARVIELLVPDVEAPAHREARLANRSSYAFAVPRESARALIDDTRLEKGGVYLLVLDRDAEEKDPLVYCGTSERVRERIGQHASGRSHVTGEGDEIRQFTRVFAAVGDDSLNMAHWRWIEAHLIQQLRRGGVVALLNPRDDTPPALSVAQATLAEEVLADVALLLPILDFDFLTGVSPSEAKGAAEPAQPQPGLPAGAMPRFELNSNGIHVDIEYRGDRFWALAGSQIRSVATTDLSGRYLDHRNRLLDPAGGLTRAGPDNTHRILVEDTPFSSPSRLVQVMAGTTVSSLDAIKVADHEMSLRQWRLQQAEDAQEAADD